LLKAVLIVLTLVVGALAAIEIYALLAQWPSGGIASLVSLEPAPQGESKAGADTNFDRFIVDARACWQAPFSVDAFVGCWGKVAQDHPAWSAVAGGLLTFLIWVVGRLLLWLGRRIITTYFFPDAARIAGDFKARTDFLLEFLKQRRSDIVEYSELYTRFLFRFYSPDILKRWGVIAANDQYLSGALSPGQVKSITDVHGSGTFQPAIVAKSRWLRSRNPKLRFALSHAGEWLDQAPAASANPLGREFLRVFSPSDMALLKRAAGQYVPNDGNNAVFALQRIAERDDGVVDLSFTLSTYRDYLNNHEALAAETYVALMTSTALRREYDIEMTEQWVAKANSIRGLPNTIACRNKHGSGAAVAGKLYRDFPAKVGVSCFTVEPQSDGRFSCLIHQRSEKLAEYPHFHHVVPAGTFAPIGFVEPSLVQEQFSIRFTIMREFLEEVFGLEEAQSDSVNDPFDIFRIETFPGFAPGRLLLSDEDLARRQIPEETDLYKIVETALGIDIVSLKPELTALMLIKQEGFLQKHKQHMKGNYEGKFVPHAFTRDLIEPALAAHLSVNKCLPAGLLAIVEGINYVTRMATPARATGAAARGTSRLPSR
jgi:hypothetical protein